MKQLLKSGTISIDYVKLEQNPSDPLTKLLGINMILELSGRMRLKPLANKTSDGNPTFVIEDP